MSTPDARALIRDAQNAQRAGDIPRAESLLERAIAAAPDSTDARVLLARLRAAIGKRPSAVQLAQDACRLAPADMRLRRLLAEMLASVNRPEDAADQLKIILNDAPRDISAWTMLGSMLVLADDLKGAEHAYEQALEASPTSAEAAAGLAALRELDGRIDDAAAILAPWLDQSPIDDRVATAFAGPARGLGQSARAIELLEEVVARRTLTGPRRERAHFALGDLYAGAKRYDDAFAAYSRGHDARHAPWNADEFDDLCARTINTYAEPFPGAYPTSSNASRTPVFIVGMPRSGTSLTEQIIASHPDAAPGGERREIRHIMRQLAIDTPGEPNFPELASRLTPAQLDRSAEWYLEQTHKLAPGAHRVTDKNPANQLRVGLIAQIFPNACFIHTRRHPLDTCISIYSKRFTIGHEFADRLPDLARRYAAYHRITAHWARIMGERFLEIDYETLVADQERVTRTILAHIGLEWHDACLRFHESGRVVTTASFEQVRRPMYASSVGRWRDYEKHLGPLIEELRVQGVPLPGVDS